MTTLVRRLSTTSVMTFAVLLAGAYQVAAAQAATGAGRAAPSFAGNAPIPFAAAKGHVLKKTYIHTGDYNATISGGPYTAVDSPVTVACTLGPCSVLAHMLVEAGGNFTTGNDTRLMLYVDGAPADNTWFVGRTPSDGSYVNLTQTTQLNLLATGNHTLEMIFQSFSGAFIAHYAVEYTVYTP
jgi:hypothetical protein